MIAGDDEKHKSGDVLVGEGAHCTYATASATMLLLDFIDFSLNY